MGTVLRMLAVGDSELVVKLAVWGGVALLAILVMVVALIWVRRSLFTGDLDKSDSTWDLQTLDAMRDRGDLTDAEYRSLRARVIQALASGMKGEPPA